MPSGKRKPHTKYHVRLLSGLLDLFQLASPEKGDKIQWDRKNRKHAGTFNEFAKEVLPRASIMLKDTYLSNLIKEKVLGARKKKRSVPKNNLPKLQTPNGTNANFYISG